MPRVQRAGWVPKYRHHRSSGQAYVTLAGRDVYLGRHGSPESRAEYDRIVAEWLSRGRAPLPEPEDRLDSTTISALILRYLDYAEPIYSPTAVSTMKGAFRPLRRLYGHTPAAEFQPAGLRAIQKFLADEVIVRKAKNEADGDSGKPRAGEAGPPRRKYCRKTINDYTARIRQLFKWGVAEGLVPAPVWQGLLAVPGLRYGRSQARENDPIGPVPDARVEAVLPHLPPMVADMVRVQRLTGARPGEICAIIPQEIDTTGAVWVYTPSHHKNSHHGKTRQIAIGPKAQAILRRYLTPDLTAPLFSPAASERDRKRLLRQARSTPLTPSQRRRDARRRARPRDDYGEQYPPAAYARAIHRACTRAGVHPWSPNQLRHSRATEVRKSYGLDAAGAVLGHAKLETTQVYAERASELAAEVALRTG